jgi:uncharacterized delta-60 repeat protein
MATGKKNETRNSFSARYASTFALIIACKLLIATAQAGPVIPEPGFGNGGLVTSTGNIFRCLAKQPDGKIIVAGSARNNSQDFVVMRYNMDGSLDHTFNGSGIVITDFSQGNDVCTAVALQSDGKIVLAGSRSDFANGAFQMSLARYNPDGSLDNTFDGDGKLLSGSLSTLDGEGSSYAMVIQKDDKIIVSGSEGIRRFNSDGAIDVSFGTAGQIVDTGRRIFSVAVQNDGKIIATGSDRLNMYLVRFNTNGSIDSSFGSGGRVTASFGGKSIGYNIAVQANGKILVAGENTNGIYGSQAEFALARYNIDGSLDNSFDGDGKVTTSFFVPLGEPIISSYSISLQQDGKIVMSGGWYLAMARYNPDGSLDNSFDGDGKVETSQQGFGLVRAGLIVENRYYVTGLSSDGSFLAAFSLGNDASKGLSYRYYEGDWNTLPDFDQLVPINSGVSSNVDISARSAGINDHFAYVWEGYINIQTPGSYTFETVSDDGSKFYFNEFYAAGAKALVNNDGLHAPHSATGSVNITTAGQYPVAVTYFEKDGGEAMQLYWQGPGIERQLLPATLFSPKGIDVLAPSVPVNLHLVYKGRNIARLDWEDASDNTGVSKYEVYANGNLFNITDKSFIDADNLQANTYYYFTVKAVDAAGNISATSNYANFTTASKGLNYKFYNNVSSPGFSGLKPTQTGVSSNADVSVRPQGVNENYAFIWEGYINIPAPGTYTFETISDDGSRFYFNTASYSAIADPLVDNFAYNGFHAALSVSNTVYVPSAGLYPVVITYNQFVYAQTMQLFWAGPNLSRQRVPDEAFTDDSKPGSLVNGLNYKYYEGNWTTLPDFTTLIPVKTGQGSNVDLSVRSTGRNDNFGFVWEGYINVPVAGDYTFETISDDGSKLYFNSLYVSSAIATVNNDGVHAAKSETSMVHIAVAGTYPISITFFENTGDEKMEVYWSGPSITRQLIPSEALSPNPSQQMNRLTYHYFQDNSTPWTMLPDFSQLPVIKTGNSAYVDISVRPPGRNDLFAFVWEGYINMPVAGAYTFETVSDDGSKLYFNRDLYVYDYFITPTVNNDGIHASKSVSSAVTITKPGIYPIAFTFFQQAGAETMEVYWSGPGMPRQRIPNEAFTLVNAAAVPTHFAMSALTTQNTEATNLNGNTTERVAGVSVYPNPFHENLAISFYNTLSANDITISVFDLNGRKVYNNHAGNLPIGNNLLKINLAAVNMNEGVYVAQIQINGIVCKTVKVVKIRK